MEDDVTDLFETAPCGYVSTDPGGRISKVNQTLADWLGLTKEDLLGRRFQDLLTIAGRIYFETHFAPLLRMQGFFHEVALDLVGADDRRLPTLVNAVERRDAEGRVEFIRITVFNAVDRRLYEQELLEARRQADAASTELRELNATLERRVSEQAAERDRIWAMSRDLFAVMGLDGFLKAINPAWQATLGFDEATLLARPLPDQVHPDDLMAAGPVLERLARGETVDRFEDRLRHADGSWRWISWTLVPQGDVFYAVGRDVTAEKENAAALARRTAERDQLWTLSEDLLARANYEGTMSAVSPAWTRVLGWSEAELLSRGYATFMHPEDLEPTLAGLTRMSETGRPTRFENRIARRDGTWAPIEWTVAPEPDGANFIAVGRDLSAAKARDEELARAQEALRQSQKMEAVGQLTGGLAHDFNNILAGILGSLDLMQTRVAQGRMADVGRYMMAAQGAAKRAAALTHRLLAFSRRQTLQPKATDVNRLVADLEELIRRTVGPSIAVEAVAKAGLWPTIVDPNQLENALLNLCINARDAMPEGGRITIETANRWLDDRAARERDLAPGQYVSLCVSDNGTGMTADVIERAFDPFFTTKPIGLGTGLGLSMVYGFARQSGGQVRLYSEVGEGTMVCLYLPRHHAQEAVDAAVAEAEPVEPAAAGETVLVIDDEPLVRMVVVDVLEELGYQALEAEDGPQGMRIIRSDARIDLLVTDVGLPNGMNGRQVAEAAREVRPGLQVLFVTGYAENAVLSHGHLDPGMQIVTKPFDMERLKSRIREMIAGR